MDCCQCEGIDDLFNAKVAARDLKSYRTKGPDKATRMLIEALKTEGIEGMTLMDIGGGVGAIQHELLQDGVSNSTHVDASRAYLQAAQEEARRQGHEDRVSYHFGDFVDLAPHMESADIVTLDSVICCYHDMESLVGLSLQRARKLYGYVYPRDTWWMKVVSGSENFYRWARRSSFRTYLHPTDAIEAVVRSNGLKRRFYRQTALWQVAVYGR